jgi:tagatose 6-phosphate kinase
MIVCLGTTPAVQRTISFERLAINDVNRAKSVKQFASGKSINAARVLHALGERTLATGILGGDTGRFMRMDMDRSGIKHDFIDAPAPTRLCITLLDESAGTATELIEEAADPGADAFDDVMAKLTELIEGGVDVLVLSGRLAPGAGDDFYAACVRLVRDAGGQTIIDAEGAPLRLALSERPTLVKPNRKELAATLGIAIDSDASLKAAARKVMSLGATWVAISDGANDTLVSDGDSFWRVATPQITPVNPIGSGDAMAAGIAAGLVRKLMVPQSVALGVGCGAANALTSHAGHVNKLAVEMLQKQVSVSLWS